MIISYRWLLEYLPEPLPVTELAAILTSIGLEVEAVEPAESIPGSLEGLVIGEVLTCEKHPNADKLSMTTVAIGGPEPLHIVCGAPNVAAGQKVVVAPVGATVHPTGGTPFLIKKAKIRGAESAGMICAEDEIGLGNSHAGVLVLPAGAVVGTLAAEYFNIPKTDFAIHIGLTPNRSDANSHIGVARDVCAYLAHHKGGKYEVAMPIATLPGAVPEGGTIQVHIDATEACPRYTGISLRGIKVGSAPEWLQRRLQTIGVRSINNIVDVTNYVLHEYGQPLHAFDADKIGGGTIRVRFEKEGTPFTGLDGVKRMLAADDLVICDATQPMAIGGVFGGQDSGIGEGTTHVFLESAYFDPKHIRRTSLRHGLRTDAATHFEKGVDINNVLPALQRAAALILQVAGGKQASGITDCYPTPLPAKTVTITYSYIHKLSGKPYKQLAIKEILTAAGFHIEQETHDGLTLKVPSNKTDVTQPADIVEEILRIDGLDNVQIPGRLHIALTKPMPGDRQARERIAGLLCGMGLQEIVTNSIVNSKYYPGNNHLVRMINSLSSELDVMRPGMMEGGLEVIQYNCNRKNQDLSLFEYGNTYATADNKYLQSPRLGIWVTGAVLAANWHQQARQADLFHLRGIMDNLLLWVGISNVKMAYDESGGGGMAWTWKNQPLCTAMQVSPQRLKEFDIKQPVFFAEVHWDTWLKAAAAHKTAYKEVPKFPAVQRDLAIVLDTDVTYAQVQEATRVLNLEALQSFGLFDVFESEKLGKGKKSYAINYTFQLPGRTLTDTESDGLMKQLADAYKSKLNAQIRE